MFDKYETKVVNKHESNHVVTNETTNIVINPITVDVGLQKRVLTFDIDSILADQILRPSPSDSICSLPHVEIIIKETFKREGRYGTKYQTDIDILSVILPLQIHQITFLGKEVCITYNYDIKHIIPLSYNKTQWSNGDYSIYGKEKSRYISRDEKYLITAKLFDILKDIELTDTNQLILEE